MKWPAPPCRWTEIAGIVTVVALLFGSGGFYGGWKAVVSQEAIDHNALWKHLEEMPPLMVTLRSAELTNVKQDGQIASLRQSVSELAEAVHQQSLNFNKMIDLIQQQRQREPHN